MIKYLNAELKIKFDLSKPDGTPRKIIDNNIAKKYGWKSKTSFKNGIKLTYQDFLKKIINEKFNCCYRWSRFCWIKLN